MARISIIFGLLLCCLSLAGMELAPAKGTTQFVPMMAGIPLLFMGVVGLNPHRRRNSTLVSIVVALLADLYGVARFFQLLGHHEPLAVMDERIVLGMSLLAASYVAVAIWLIGLAKVLFGRTYRG